jgi:hypothetical protein
LTSGDTGGLFGPHVDGGARHVPESRAARRAASSTMPPARAIDQAHSRLHDGDLARDSMFSVSFERGTCTVTMSDCVSSD